MQMNTDFGRLCAPNNFCRMNEPMTIRVRDKYKTTLNAIELDTIN